LAGGAFALAACDCGACELSLATPEPFDVSGLSTVPLPADPDAAFPGGDAPVPVAFPAACAAPTVSRKRRATGASTVDDADFTNSPMPLS
jgi:hypothetical protein